MEILSSRAVIGAYYQTLEEGSQAWVEQIASTFSSNQKSETIAWADATPKVREWVGGRHAVRLGEKFVAIANKEFEATLDFHKRDFTRANAEQVLSRVSELAISASQLNLEQVSNLIIGGAADASYDGQFFYDTDHSEGDSGTQSNDIQVDISALPTTVHGTTTAPSPEELQIAALQGIQKIKGFKDDKGRPMNVHAQHFQVMAPTSYFYAGTEAFSSPLIAAGKSNTLLQPNNGLKVDFVVNPYLDSAFTEAFVVHRVDGKTKPFIITDEGAVEATMLGVDSEYCHTTNRVQFGVNMSRGYGYGRWQGSCLVTLV